jgi:hypothetical protein
MVKAGKTCGEWGQRQEDECVGIGLLCPRIISNEHEYLLYGPEENKQLGSMNDLSGPLGYRAKMFMKAMA